MKRRITVKIGQPLNLPPQLAERKERYEMISKALHEALSQMLEPLPQS